MGLDDRNKQFIPMLLQDSSSIVFTHWRRSLSVTQDQTFLMGDRDEDCAGNNRIPYSSRKIITRHTTRDIALSCWKRVLGTPRRQGTANGRKI
ncbi:hypothetical protein TNCV_2486691 [Trichonephila clavipes]|uniref:Uncharacterized protein n=1 Tax=Trichonephila clavipes TaxID=2585209 RepID=A0A8X7BCD7_TRICX|nr:hypothetical protein TNCV_2486691 [Trichonephila clavipes]